MSYWGVIQSEPQRETVACHFLSQAGFETYCPRIETPKPGLHQAKTSALFPRYLFVVIVDRFHTVRWTPGVTALLMRDGRPARIADSVVASIRACEGDDGLIKLSARPSGLRPGVPIRIVSGSFENRIGIYQDTSGPERSRILLSLLGREVVVQLATSDIEALSHFD
jgi:transcriptional antiterminator RfaH